MQYCVRVRVHIRIKELQEAVAIAKSEVKTEPGTDSQIQSIQAKARIVGVYMN